MSTENQPEVHVTVVENTAPSSSSPEVVEAAQDQLAQAVGTAAALVDMAKAIGDDPAKNDRLDSLHNEVRETNRLLRDLVGEMRATREKVEQGNDLQALDIIADAQEAEQQAATTEEIGEIVKEEIKPLEEIAKVEEPKKRKSRWL